MSFRAIASRVGRYVPLVVSVVLLAAVAWQFDGWHLFRSANLVILLAALALSLLLNTGLAAFKWWLVVRESGVNISYREVYRLVLGLLSVTFFAPFQSGHLLYAVALRRHAGVPRFHALEAVAYDKWLSLVGTFALIALGQLILPDDHDLKHPLILIGGAGVVLVYFGDRLLFKLLGRWSFFRERSQFLQRPISLPRKLVLLLLATVYQCSDTFSMYLACLALGLDIAPEVVFGAYSLVLLLTYAPISISGFGVRENLIAFFFAGELTYNRAVASGFLVDFLEYVVPALFGAAMLPGMLRLLWRFRKTDGLEDPSN